MALYELFTKEEHEKIEREYDSMKEKDVEKLVKKVSAYSWKISNNGGDDRLNKFRIMAYLADKE